MDRRRLLKSGAALAGAAGAGVLEDGCAHQAPAAGAPPLPPLPDPRVIEQVLSSFDRRLAWIDRQELPPSLAPPSPASLSAEQQAQVDGRMRLFRKAVRTLYVTGRFMDLPDEIQTHPDVQARVLGAQAEMDEAVFGTTALLESLRPENHRAIQGALRARPELGEQLAKMMDAPARDDGIPFRRRMAVRTTTTGLADRMKAQSPALTIDPLVRRVRKLAARPQATATSRLMAAKLGEAAFWQHQQRLKELSARWQRQLAQAAPQPYDSPATAAPPPDAGAPAAAPNPAASPAPRQALDSPTASPPSSSFPSRSVPSSSVPESSGHKTLSAGGHIMGFGLGSVGVGLIFAGLYQVAETEAFLWPALIFGVTVGPILLVVGLIVVIVGAIMIAAE